MDNVNEVDILENILMQRDERLLPELLADRSSGENIIWATDIYASLGEGYEFHDEITVEKITGENGLLIRPRVKKSLQEQIYRSREKGEIFTPAWMCNFQNNVLDEEWYGEAEVFNRELEKDWLSVARPVPFPSPTGKTWKDYVRSRRMEITCGEAPYLVSRYDATTGVVIPVKNRIGILDRKLRVVNENTKRKKDWYVWARQAFCSTYAYEWQGDSLLLARENLLLTYLDYFKDRWDESEEPDADEFLRIAEIISWNIWQMDGLKGVVPDSCHDEVSQSKDFFEGTKMVVSPCPGCSSGNIREHNGIFCVLRDWEARGETEPLPFVDFLTHLKTEPSSNMKFDYIIGNPPYQENDGGAQASAKPIYPYFVQAAKNLQPCFISLIIPARWFSGGKGLDEFRAQMLNDRHIRHLIDYFDATDCFSNADISGGVCIFIWNREAEGDCIVESNINGKSSVMKRPLLENNSTVFIRFNEAVGILRKVILQGGTTFDKLVSVRKPFGITTNADISSEKTNADMIKVYAFPKNGYIDRSKVILHQEWIDMNKVCISYAYGERGEFPYQVIGRPFIASAGSCCTETYLVVTVIDDLIVGNNMMKYMMSRFFRSLVLLKKNTQHATSKVYSCVPLQDFTSSSDIDWSKSIPEIDRQLYAKYGLDEREIEFIETHVKEMQ